MNIIGWIILGFVALLLIGRKQKESPSHPANALKPVVQPGNASAGDAFNVGGTISSGVPETSPLHCNHISILPITAHFPVDPPPIAIQRPVPLQPKPPIRPVTFSALGLSRQSIANPNFNANFVRARFFSSRTPTCYWTAANSPGITCNDL